MKYESCVQQSDFGPNPYVASIDRMAGQNQNFRTAIWTGQYLQMTLMCIPPCDEIGLEMHADTDQFIRVEQGMATVRMGRRKEGLSFQQSLGKGDAVFVPAGTWHNIINVGRNVLKVSSIYAPPNHPWGTVHYTKADAKREEH